jgi:hypothetical protein
MKNAKWAKTPRRDARVLMRSMVQGREKVVDHSSWTPAGFCLLTWFEHADDPLCVKVAALALD